MAAPAPAPAFTPKKIYPEDRIFYTTKKKDGSFYIAHTTLNKEKKQYGGMEYLQKIDNVPDEELLTGEQETTKGGTVRYFMRKELPEFQEWLFQECKAICVDEKNPFVTPKFSLSDYKKSVAPAPVTGEPVAKKQKVEEPPRNTEEIMKEIKEIKKLLILLHTVVGSKNKDSEITMTEQPDDDDSVDDTGDEHAS